MEVAGPLFGYALKDLAEHGDGRERLRHAVLVSMLLNAFFLPSAKFYNQLFKDGLVGSSVDASYESMNSCGYIIITGESDAPETVYQRLDALFANVEEHLPDEETFARIRKAMYADAVRVLDSTEDIAGEIVHAAFHGYDLWDPLEVISSIDHNEFIKFAKGYFADKQGVTATVMPAKDRKEGDAR